MGTSRLPGFYKMRIAERLRRVAEQLEVDGDELDGLAESGTLPLANADAMIENAGGVLGRPVGVGLNFVENAADVLLPTPAERPPGSPPAGLRPPGRRPPRAVPARRDPPPRHL